ncbi:hypothetical protein SUDANB145_04061 [Streptomyces sp. enrichment culture]|uniref:hypothetical protein n=1 Tax=Streptomyces sp. enrichment culture TaxID=1795815 RepID=UPI003F57C5C7
MSDRLHEPYARRTDPAVPVRPGPRVAQRPLASLQAGAGNRAVATAIQRAAATQEKAAGASRTRAETSGTRGSTERQQDDAEARDNHSGDKGSGNRGGDKDSGNQGGDKDSGDGGSGSKGPEDRAKKLKDGVGVAARERADAEAEVWEMTVAAAAAHGRAVEADGRATMSRHAAEDARSKREQAEGEEREWTLKADDAQQRREEAERDVLTRIDAEADADGQTQEARQRADEAKAEVRRRRAEAEDAKAEVRRRRAEADEAERAATEAAAAAERYRKEAEQAEKAAAEARKKAKACQERVDDLAEKTARAEAEVRERARAEAEAQKRAKQAAEHALAEVRAADVAAREAVERAAGAEATARQRTEQARTADEELEKADSTAKKCAEALSDADQRAERADATMRERTGELAVATRQRQEAQGELEAWRSAEAEARGKAEQAGEARREHERTQADAEERARTAGAQAEGHWRVVRDARRQAADAARRQLAASDVETSARTAMATAKKEAAEAAEQAARTQEAARSGTGKTGMKERVRQLPAKVKAVLDVPDTLNLRLTSPVGGGVRTEATRDNDIAKLVGTAQQGQFETGMNAMATGFNLTTDLQGLAAGLKKHKGTGPDSHQARKDVRGKSAGAATNATMGVGDVSKIVDNAARNAGTTGGLTALGHVSGDATVVFSTVIAARDGKAIANAVEKRRKLEARLADVKPTHAGNLQALFHDLGSASAELARHSAGLGTEQGDPSEKTIADIGVLKQRIDDYRSTLLAHLAFLKDYAVRKQNRKIFKRGANLGGNVVRIAGATLSIAALSGATLGVAPAVVGGLGAGVLGLIAAWKGGRKGRKRVEVMRHPKRWARTTLAQDETESTEVTGQSTEVTGQGTENETRSTENGTQGAENIQAADASQDVSADEPGDRRKRAAVLEFVKVLKSIEQGERQRMAQELYALAAGPAVPASRHVPGDIRELTRGMLKELKCGPDKHGQTEEEWAKSLNDPDLQREWEGSIAKQLAS